MRIKTPVFWYADGGQSSWQARILKPVSALYGWAQKKRSGKKPSYHAAIPVICIGNITAGGSGKTPTALALYDFIMTEFPGRFTPCFLTRGYGGTAKAPLLVNPHHHDAATIGDEALLLAEKAAVIVSADRVAGAKLAESSGFDLIIMDDGMQNPYLHKDMIIVTVDAATGFGNGLLLPAGPLREAITDGMERADAIIMIGIGASPLPPALADMPDKPVLRARISPAPHWDSDKTSSYVAFAGLGHPEKFRKTLDEYGISLAAWYPYPDHYPYQDKDIAFLLAEAKNLGARLITTEKDAKRLPDHLVSGTKPDVAVMPVTLQFENTHALSALLQRVL